MASLPNMSKSHYVSGIKNFRFGKCEYIPDGFRISHWFLITLRNKPQL